MKTVLIIVISLTLLGVGCATVDDSDQTLVEPVKVIDPGVECNQAGGNWLSDQSECEYISADWCEQAGGEFEVCASACRHEPKAEICTLQCVPVCIFD